MTPKLHTQAVIVGGGPAGSAAALHLLERGITPTIVEKVSFPRFHIGESMTGECGALVRQLGFTDQMDADGHQVKHGVVVYGPRGNDDWFLPVMRRPAEDAPLEPQTTWQVRRSVFDKMLLDEAVARGAVLIEGRASSVLSDTEGLKVGGVSVECTDGTTLDIEADWTLDCSGQSTFLANQKATGPKYLGAYDKQIAIFGHVGDFVRGQGDPSEREKQPGNTHIFYKQKYQWAWAIPIDDVATSVGIVVPAQYFRDSGESKSDFLQRELLELNPGLAARIESPELLEPAHVIPNYSFQVRGFAGPGYVCVGDSHRFVDPIFSFGLYIALMEASLAAAAVGSYIDAPDTATGEAFTSYMIGIEQAIDKLEDMIDAFWENPLAFSVLVHRKYRDTLVDLFAGRIYERQPTGGLDNTMAAFRKLLDRERTYDADGLFSVPIGSRYHPERAPLWNSQLDSVETTEAWMRDLD